MLIITLTSGRPKAFEQCKKLLSQQTHEDNEWLVVSDNYEDYKFPKNAKVIKRDPSPDTLPSICHNMLAALDYMKTTKHERAAIWEDDDWYTKSYLYETNKLLDKAELVGWNEDAYYYVLTRKAKRTHNITHASLAATAFRRSVIPYLEECCQHGEVFIDLVLWNGITVTEMVARPPAELPDGSRLDMPPIPVVSILKEFKGSKLLAHNFTGIHWGSSEQPKLNKEGNIANEYPRHVGLKENWHGGAVGLSVRGHNPNMGGGPDTRGKILAKWLGEDAAFYLATSPWRDFLDKNPYPAGVMLDAPIEADAASRF